MKRRRRIIVRIRRVDILIVLVLLAIMIGALVRWPEKMLADVAIPAAILIAFVVGPER
jgi:hypothetical protein